MRVKSSKVELFRFEQPVGRCAWVDADITLTEWYGSDENPYPVRSMERVRGLSTGAPIGGEKVEGSCYQVFEDAPSLFTQFATLKLDEQSIRAFANQYGRLGVSLQGDVDGVTFWIEKYSDWKKNIEAVRSALYLYHAFETNDPKVLEHLVRVIELEPLDAPSNTASRDPGQNAKEVRYAFILDDKDYGFQRYLLPSRFSNELRERMASDYSLVAKMLFWEIVNDSLRESLSPYLSLNYEATQFSLRFQPRRLIDAIWLQVATMAEKKSELKRCVICKSFIEVKERGSNKNLYCCSDACRQLNQRNKIAKVQHLAAQGLGVEEIAHTVESAPDKVVKWIKSARPKELHS